MLDHHIHYFDLRAAKEPLFVFRGHKKAVSYVKFMSKDEIVSAYVLFISPFRYHFLVALFSTPFYRSTDSTLKLWKNGQSECVRTFAGYVYLRVLSFFETLSRIYSLALNPVYTFRRLLFLQTSLGLLSNPCFTLSFRTLLFSFLPAFLPLYSLLLFLHKREIGEGRLLVEVKITPSSIRSFLSFSYALPLPHLYPYRHTNEKNFVGLAVNGDYVCCGSENNGVYAYYKMMSKPIVGYKFGSSNPVTVLAAFFKFFFFLKF